MVAASRAQSEVVSGNLESSELATPLAALVAQEGHLVYGRAECDAFAKLLHCFLPS